MWLDLVVPSEVGFGAMKVELVLCVVGFDAVKLDLLPGVVGVGACVSAFGAVRWFLVQGMVMMCPLGGQGACGLHLLK